MSSAKKKYSLDILPHQLNVEKYAIPYTPENFTPEEKKYLKPFFSNIHKPVFVVQHLPEEVIGALSSRYSRATKSLRRMFLDEYITPILKPEQQKDWLNLSDKEMKEAGETREAFLEMIDFYNKNEGIDKVVNVQRGRKFFDRWLAQFGDDSIAELGAIHLCIEGLSIIATKEIEDKRVGLSPLEKSTRYVEFGSRRPDGEYQYIIPGEIKGTPLEREYKDAMDYLFYTYVKIGDTYVDYVKKLYPKGEDETDQSFHNSRSAKRFDDLRDLLPFSTQTNLALLGNGRAFENLLNSLMDHPLGELRWWGQQMLGELNKSVPSFVKRVASERGAEEQVYRNNINFLREEQALKILKGTESAKEQAKGVRLVDYSKDADVKIITSYLFASNKARSFSMEEIRKKIAGLSKRERAVLIKQILDERKFGRKDAKRETDRFHKVPRAFENAHYMFEIWARGGDYRDLHRHRQNTQERQVFTAKWGFDLEKDVKKSPFLGDISLALEKASKVFKEMKKISSELAQYTVPFAYLQHWYMNLSAKEIYWMVELRTGPQGKSHYRKICQQIALLAKSATPSVFLELMVDMQDYSLARRESEKKIEKKLRGI